MLGGNKVKQGYRYLDVGNGNYSVEKGQRGAAWSWSNDGNGKGIGRKSIFV